MPKISANVLEPRDDVVTVSYAEAIIVSIIPRPATNHAHRIFGSSSKCVQANAGGNLCHTNLHTALVC